MMINNRKEYKAQFFIPVCLGEIEFNSLTFHDEDQKRIAHESFHISDKCRYCNVVITRQDSFCITESYWKAVGFLCHTACLKKGKATEEYECQLLDQSCNDCRFFVRNQIVKTSSIGTCRKNDGGYGIVSVKAFPVTSVGHLCFVHRKQTCALPSCGEIYTPETTNQRYCSDKCCTEAKTGPVQPDPRIAVWERTRAYLRSLYQ